VKRSTSAPGKAVLAGEYAVLEGAPAIAMAVNCRARVAVLPSPDGRCSVQSAGGHIVHFGTGAPGELQWLDGGEHQEHALFQEVWREAKIGPAEPMAFTLDTRTLFDGASGAKLGLGSSAALAVALAAALHGGDRARVSATAAAAHSAFQGGRGSGVDVAVAIEGGIIAYSRDRQAEKLEWPDGLQYDLFWCGRPASTAEKIEQATAHRGAAARRTAAALADASAEVLQAWKQGRDIALVEALETYIEVLRKFSDDHDLGIFEGGHQDLCDIAGEYRLVYKPCGAGGGDTGILLAPHGADTAEFTARAEGLGFRKLPCRLDPRGLMAEDREHR
jgi:phosphomevalonate kinase